ncbi:hypothetical protein QYF36_006619 [Acer negundo]|nr:hypothetical protein QYF36_006619 [Acer negundo]
MDRVTGIFSIHSSFCYQIHFNGFDLITNLRDKGPGRAPIVKHTGRAKEHRVRGRAEVLFGVEEGPEEPETLSALASEDRLIFLG